MLPVPLQMTHILIIIITSIYIKHLSGDPRMLNTKKKIFKNRKYRQQRLPWMAELEPRGLGEKVSFQLLFERVQRHNVADLQKVFTDLC